jgi:phenylacetate-coenzyme A ligase PaaK-like adenylate-forming protein
VRAFPVRRSASLDEFPRATELALAGLGCVTAARVWPHLRERLEAPWQPEAEVAERHWQRLRDLLVYCWREVPFYRERWQQAGVDPTRFAAPEDATKLPLVTRAELTEGRRAGGFPRTASPGTQPLVTSGTTSGQPFELWIGFSEYQMKYANHLRQMYLSGWRLGRRSSALHYSGHGQFRGRYSGRSEHREAWPGLRDVALAVAHRKQVLTPYHRRDSGDDALVGGWYRALARHRPLLLDTFYVNALLLLEHVGRHALPPLEVPILFVLHSLADRERERLSRTFQADVFNRYSPHECEGIAFDCGAHAGLHVALDSYHVEILDRDGRATGPEQVGRLTVTDLENRTMPLVRYQIGDLGHWRAMACPCGSPFPLMAGLDGREADVLEWGARGPLSPAALESFLQGDDRVQLYQVRGREGEIEVAIVSATPGFPDMAWSRTCVTHLRALFEAPPTVRVKAVEHLPFEPNGKFAFVARASRGAA